MRRIKKPLNGGKKEDTLGFNIATVFIPIMLVVITVFLFFVPHNNQQEAKAQAQCAPQKSVSASMNNGSVEIDEDIAGPIGLLVDSMVDFIGGDESVLCADTDITVYLDTNGYNLDESYPTEEYVYGISNLSKDENGKCTFLNKDKTEEIKSCSMAKLSKDSKLYDSLVKSIKNSQSLAELDWDNKENAHKAKIEIDAELLVIDGLKCESFCDTTNQKG